MPALRVPYAVQAHDQLGVLCTRFASYAGSSGTATARDCVWANAHVPGTLAQGVVIQIQVPGGSVSITTPAAESFMQALDQATAINPNTTLDLLADAIASLPDALQPGALLLLPPARLPVTTAPKDIEGLYGVDGAGFALANMATPGLLSAHVELSLRGTDGALIKVTTQPNDTLNTVAVRFALAGLATDAGAIAQGNAGAALFAGQALALLPPASVGIDSFSLVPPVVFPDTPAMPRFFALAPLYDHLVTRQVGIRQLKDDGTLETGGVATSFMAIDAEPWVLRFLGDMDRFLGGPMATRLYSIDALRSDLAGAIGSKSQLAEGISRQLQLVFDYSAYPTSPDPGFEKGLAAARDALKQQLQVSLLNAYDTSVVAQYDTRSITPWPPGATPPVSLYGQARLVGAATPVIFAASKTGFEADMAYVSFFASVADPERHSWIRGTLDYACSHAEFAITSTGVPAGYQASNWLSFMPLQDRAARPKALENTHPGNLLAPVPLRRYPLLPSIREQAAEATYPHPNGLDQLGRWTYRLTCAHPFAAQDGVRIFTEFNLATGAQLRDTPPSVDLFSALAQYAAVADKLWALLDAPAQQPTSATYICAARTFAELAASIACRWDLRLTQDEGRLRQEANYTVGARYAFNARVTYSEDGQSIDSFSLTREQGQPGPSQAWPTVEVMMTDGTYVPLKIRPPATPGSTTVYVPDSAITIPVQDQQTFRIAWNDIGVGAFQNARARMLAVRNENLLYDPEAAETPSLPTSSAFLFKTAEVTATSIVTPLIERSQPQAISGPDVATALGNAIQTLFPSSDTLQNTTASWGVFYAYELSGSATPGDSLISKLPVALYPNQPLTGAAQAMADAVQTWTHHHHPATRGGGWLFDVILYSGLEASTRPLFSAELSYTLGQAQGSGDSGCG
ncbi:hypothetical protein WG628_09710 [Stenotrophomonas maltophilia]